MKILSIGGNGHDISFTVLEDGLPTVLVEKERLTRVKMEVGGAETFAYENCKELDSIDCLVKDKLSKAATWELLDAKMKYDVWHHTAHAAHAFYSSHFDESIIFSIDGGGRQDDGLTALTVWEGKGNKLSLTRKFPFSGVETLNLGGVYSSITGRVLGLSIFGAGGNQSGTVMAMAAFGNPERFRPYFQYPEPLLEVHVRQRKARRALPKQTHPLFPVIENLIRLVITEQDRYDVAAALQEYTERSLRYLLSCYPAKNICLSGGVALNSVAAGKMLDWFPDSNIYVCPVPYDGGLSIGGAQYVWHHIMNNPRINWDDNISPYLGYSYSRQDVERAIHKIGNYDGNSATSNS